MNEKRLDKIKSNILKKKKVEKSTICPSSKTIEDETESNLTIN